MPGLEIAEVLLGMTVGILFVAYGTLLYFKNPGTFQNL